MDGRNFFDGCIAWVLGFKLSGDLFVCLCGLGLVVGVGFCKCWPDTAEN